MAEKPIRHPYEGQVWILARVLFGSLLGAWLGPMQSLLTSPVEESALAWSYCIERAPGGLHQDMCTHSHSKCAVSLGQHTAVP